MWHRVVFLYSNLHNATLAIKRVDLLITTDKYPWFSFVSHVILHHPARAPTHAKGSLTKGLLASLTLALGDPPHVSR